MGVIMKMNTRSNNIDVDMVLVAYGVDKIKKELLLFVPAIVISIYLKDFFEFLIVYIFLSTLRQNAGGFHLKSSKACYIFSLSTIVIFPYISGLFSYYGLYNVLSLFMAIVIAYFSPADSASKRLTENEKKYFSKKIKKILMVTILILYIIPVVSFKFSIISSLFLTFISVIIRQIVTKEKEIKVE